MSDELIKKSETEELFPDEEFKEMVEAGVFYGRRKSKTHPRMKPYVLTNRGGLEIINLHKAKEGLERVFAFVKEKAAMGGMALLVGTQPSAIGVEEVAKKYGFPLVTKRWLGGTLTNFKIISRRVEYYKKLRSDMASGAFEKYTKKERVKIDGEIRRLQELMGGLENLDRLPDFVVIIDPSLHHTAVREANRSKIPIITLADVNSDPDGLDYFVVGNNKARKSVQWFLGRIDEAITEGKKNMNQMPVKEVNDKKAVAVKSVPDKIDLLSWQ